MNLKEVKKCSKCGSKKNVVYVEVITKKPLCYKCANFYKEELQQQKEDIK